MVHGTEMSTRCGATGRTRQHCLWIITGVTASFVVQSIAPQMDDRRTQELPPSASGYPTHCWAYFQCLGVQMSQVTKLTNSFIFLQLVRERLGTQRIVDTVASDPMPCFTTPFKQLADVLKSYQVLRATPHIVEHIPTVQKQISLAVK